MSELSQQQLEKYERLLAITQQVGLSIWQLQELEGASAKYFVLVALAQRGMGLDAGNALFDKAQSKTFGATIAKLVKAKHLPVDVAPRFEALLKERNWLVHNSRSTNRDAAHNDAACSKLILRIEAIAEEASLLIGAVSKATKKHVEPHGISREQVDAIVVATLESWQIGNAN